MMMSHIEKLKLQRGNALVLIRAVTQDDAPFYAYLNMTADQYKSAQDIFRDSKPFELLKLGNLIHTEMLPEPPEYVRDYIREEYALKGE